MAVAGVPSHGAATVNARFVAKLSAPRQVRIAQRPRVHELIDDALRAGVCWLAAPAGYGKTTAVVDYLHGTKAPYVWYRVDEGDQDIARFYHYLARTLRSAKMAEAMPVFGSEYAERPREFARMFFRAYFEHLEPDTVLALDDLHDANTPEFRAMLAVMLRELPEGIRCICLSRTLPHYVAVEQSLHAKQHIHADRECLFDPQRHLRRKRGASVDQVGQGRAPHSQNFRRARDRQAQLVQDFLANELAGMGGRHSDPGYFLAHQ